MGNTQYNRNNMDNKMNEILLGIQYGVCLSHIHWGIWGINESIRRSKSWNYLEYGRQRLLSYIKLKQNLTS